MIFIDSDSIIDYLRGKENVTTVINNFQEEIATTEINVFEVMFGIYLKQNVSQKQINSANEFFSNLKIFSFSQGCGKKSAEILSSLIKQGKEIEQNDCLIASVILGNSYSKILTNNKKHFDRIRGLESV